MRQSDEVGIAAAQVDVADAQYGGARASLLPHGAAAREGTSEIDLAVMERGQEIAGFLQKLPETDFTYLSVGGGFRGTPNNGSIFIALAACSRSS